MNRAAMETLLHSLRELSLLSVFLRLSLAVAFGGLIGIDRGRKRRAAGLRTHMLVCMGAALVMITNQYICEIYQMADPARLGAQVISGIGFLGAGTIIVTRHQQVIGLTTAAGLWASACMGLAVGIGFYEGALIACVFIALIIIPMHRLDNRVTLGSRVMEVYVELVEDAPLSRFLSKVVSAGLKVSYMEIMKSRDNAHNGSSVLITLKLPKRTNHAELLEEFRQLECIQYIEEV